MPSILKNARNKLLYNENKNRRVETITDVKDDAVSFYINAEKSLINKDKKIPDRMINIINTLVDLEEMGGKPIEIDWVNLANNKIEDMCDLSKIKSGGTIIISSNPVKKIRFANYGQFLNIEYHNDFGDFKLPKEVKEDSLRCVTEIQSNIMKNPDLEKAIRKWNKIDEDQIKELEELTPKCKKIYDRLQFDRYMCNVDDL